MKHTSMLLGIVVLLATAIMYILFISDVDTPTLLDGDGYYLINDTQQAMLVDDAEGISDTEQLVETFITTNNQEASMETKQVTIQTNKGTITLELFTNDAPKTVENFLTLVNKDYYDGIIFHRVISGFMIQGGDPTGTGSGGPGYTFADELDPTTESYKRGYVRGTLAMANAGPNTNGSQFFIMHKDYPLPNAYTIFGRVVNGIDVVDAIAATPVDGRDKPLEDIVMESVTVVE